MCGEQALGRRCAAVSSAMSLCPMTTTCITTTVTTWLMGSCLCACVQAKKARAVRKVLSQLKKAAPAAKKAAPKK